MQGAPDLLVEIAWLLVQMYYVDAQQGVQVRNTEACCLVAALLPLLRITEAHNLATVRDRPPSVRSSLLACSYTHYTE